MPWLVKNYHFLTPIRVGKRQKLHFTRTKKSHYPMGQFDFRSKKMQQKTIFDKVNEGICENLICLTTVTIFVPEAKLAH